jgi:tetratricopeptide (TPR) repeat protein
MIKTLFAEALTRELAGDYERARTLYEKLAFSEDPYRPALVNLGSLYARMNLLDEALDCFSRALTIHEDHLAWFNLGSVLYRTGDFKQSIVAFERARRIAPAFVLASLVMGLALRKMEHFASAEHCFFDALAIDPGNEVAMTSLAIMAYDAGHYEKALEHVGMMLSLKPDSVIALKMRGKIFLALGRAEGAVDLKKAKKDDEGFVRFDRFVGRIKTSVFDDAMGTLDNKIDKLEEKIDEKGNPSDLIALSLCCLFNGESDRAIDYLFMAKNAENR